MIFSLGLTYFNPKGPQSWWVLASTIYGRFFEDEGYMLY